MAEQHFNNEPWFIVEAESEANQPHIQRFRTRRQAVAAASIRAFEDRKIYHVFKAERTASVHPQQAKVYDESHADEG